jgi:hypothetical protein
MEMGPEELTRYEGTQENIELREKIREKLAEADLRWTAGDQEPGTYENALADAVMVVVRPLLSHCTCGVPGLTYDGPREDCAVHGAVRALNMWQRRAERAEEERDEWRRVASCGRRTNPNGT